VSSNASDRRSPTWPRLAPLLLHHLDAAQLGHSSSFHTFVSSSHNTVSRIDHIFLHSDYADHSLSTTVSHYPSLLFPPCPSSL
jgi:endonuclease/exonuclease/phosphatase family metal-dependent hydrolase